LNAQQTSLSRAVHPRLFGQPRLQVLQEVKNAAALDELWSAARGSHHCQRLGTQTEIPGGILGIEAAVGKTMTFNRSISVFMAKLLWRTETEA
jgi:hypothetical protein